MSFIIYEQTRLWENHPRTISMNLSPRMKRWYVASKTQGDTNVSRSDRKSYRQTPPTYLADDTPTLICNKKWKGKQHIPAALAPPDRRWLDIFKQFLDDFCFAFGVFLVLISDTDAGRRQVSVPEITLVRTTWRYGLFSLSVLFSREQTLQIHLSTLFHKGKKAVRINVFRS